MASKDEAVSDFRFSRGCPGGAFLSLCKSVVLFIMLPLGLISIFNYLSVEMSGTGGISFETILSDLTLYLDALMLYASPLIILSIPLGFYPRGNYARIPFKFIYGLYAALMLLMFTNGGVLSMEMPSLGIGEIQGITVDLKIQAVILILALISVMKGFMSFSEFASYRKDYLEELSERKTEKSNSKEDKSSNETKKEEIKKEDKKEEKK